MEQIIVIILFHQDHLLHKNKEERRRGTWPRIGAEHYPAGDIYLLASWLVCEVLKGWCTQLTKGACLMQLCPWVAETATCSAFPSGWALSSLSLPGMHNARIRACVCMHKMLDTGQCLYPDTTWVSPWCLTRQCHLWLETLFQE